MKAYPQQTVREISEGVTSEEGGQERLKGGTRIKRKTVWQSQNPLLYSRRLAGDFPRFVGRLCLDQKQLLLNRISYLTNSDKLHMGEWSTILSTTNLLQRANEYLSY
jgi:hypothetical protein